MNSGTEGKHDPEPPDYKDGAWIDKQVLLGMVIMLLSTILCLAILYVAARFAISIFHHLPQPDRLVPTLLLTAVCVSMAITGWLRRRQEEAASWHSTKLVIGGLFGGLLVVVTSIVRW